MPLVTGSGQEADAARGRRLEAVLGVPFTTGNRVDVLRNGDEVFPALLEAVEAASRSIDVLWFLWGRGEVTERMAAALAERAGSGVRVRVLLDGFGARGMAGEQVARMRRAGVVVASLHPLGATASATSPTNAVARGSPAPGTPPGHRLLRQPLLNFEDPLRRSSSGG